ncbi:MAG TPA: LamG domain-containing protein [Bacteroides sp.]|nr:LamG domain-containing protein [Bacteroides sp.]
MRNNLFIPGILFTAFSATFCLFNSPVAYSQTPGFYAYYTRLGFEDGNNTGKYADIVINVNQLGEFVFSREYSYLPYLQIGNSKHFVDKIIPIIGDGPAERPDRINKCSSVRVIENTSDKIIIHWRYAPDLNSENFTDFKSSYGGDIGKYFADYVDEYFTINPDGSVIRTVKKGCYSLDEWNDPMNATTQAFELTSKGIVNKSTTTAKLQSIPGDPVKGTAIKNGGNKSPAAWWRFDEGLSKNYKLTKESIQGHDCVISGMDSYWRAGVSGTSLSFDGYTNKVSLPASQVPEISGDFTIEAWIAPQEYSWNWSGIVDHDQDKRAGYSLGINHLGQIGLHAYIAGEWQGLISSEKVDLLKWTLVTGVYEKTKGFSIYFNGVLMNSKPVSGEILDAKELDLYIGMAHEKQYHWAFERNVTTSFLSNMVFSGLIDEVRIFDRALASSEISTDYQAFKPDNVQPLQYWVLPAGPEKAGGFGAAYTKLECSPEWDGLWRVGEYTDILVSFDDKPSRFVFWRGTNYLPSLVTKPGAEGIWNSDQGPEDYTDECFEHMSDKICRFSHVRLIENTDARVVVHWRNASVSISYEWLQEDENGWGLWTDEYWYIYPDAVSVRYQVSGRLADFHDIQTQQNELLSQPGTRPEDIVPFDAITLSNLEGETETWNYSVGKTFRNGAAIGGNKNLVYMNLKSEYKHFNIGEVGSNWRPYSQWQSMRLGPGLSRYNTWNHYPFGILPSDGTVRTGTDRVSSSCLGTLDGLHHLLDDGRTEAYNIYGMTNLPASDLKMLNRSWNSAAAITDLNRCESSGYDKRQRAYLINKESDGFSFSLQGSETEPIVNPCFVIKDWGSQSLADLEINGEKIIPDRNFRQGIIRDTDGTETMIIWIRQESLQPVNYKIQSSASL